MNYLITQTRTDAIGFVQDNLRQRLDYKELPIKWFKFMPLSYLSELIYTLVYSFKLKKEDVLLSCNSKSIHTHLFPLLTKAKIYQIHYHFDEKVLGLHKLPFFSYSKLFSKVHTIFTNTYMKDLAVKKYGCNNWSVVYLGVDNDVFKDKELDRYKNSFLYVGSFGQRKNIDRMLKAFSKVVEVYPDAILTICNGSYGSYAMIKDLVNALEIEGNISYLGEVSMERLVDEYNVAENFVFPTLVEGFGLPLVEAQACGCKVVTSNLPVHREVTNNTETYVDPNNDEDIARGMLDCLERYNVNKTVLNWDKTAEELKEIVR